MDTGEKFLEQLRAEQLLHKEHRFKYVVHKLLFATTLFSLGSMGLGNNILISLIYLAPIVALCYDIYIFAEDYKVKRIGIFLLDIKKDTDINEKVKEVISDLEIIWENWLKMYREPLAYKASFIITILVTIGSAFILSIDIFNAFSWHRLFLLAFWLLIVIISTILVFYYGRSLRRRFTVIDEKMR